MNNYNTDNIDGYYFCYIVYTINKIDSCKKQINNENKN